MLGVKDIDVELLPWYNLDTLVNLREVSKYYYNLINKTTRDLCVRYGYPIRSFRAFSIMYTNEYGISRYSNLLYYDDSIRCMKFIEAVRNNNTDDMISLNITRADIIHIAHNYQLRYVLRTIDKNTTDTMLKIFDLEDPIIYGKLLIAALYSANVYLIKSVWNNCDISKLSVSTLINRKYNKNIFRSIVVSYPKFIYKENINNGTFQEKINRLIRNTKDFTQKFELIINTCKKEQCDRIFDRYKKKFEHVNIVLVIHELRLIKWILYKYENVNAQILKNVISNYDTDIELIRFIGCRYPNLVSKVFDIHKLMKESKYECIELIAKCTTNSFDIKGMTFPTKYRVELLKNLGIKLLT